MRVSALSLVPLFALAACNRQGSDDTSDTNNGDVPNILADAEQTEQCANYEAGGCPFGAATAYFAGDYSFSGNDVTGHEYYYWMPNDVLAGQSDDWEPNTPCLMVWEFFGTKEDNPVDCAACLYTISGDASFRAADSDCAPALEMAEGNDWNDIFYKVRDSSSGGGVTLYFASDTVVGEGTSTAGGLEWRSEGLCRLVGATEEGCTPQ